MIKWALALCVTFGGGCTGSNNSLQASKPDIHTAVATGDEATLLRYIAAGKDIDEKDPFGGSSPLITAAVFGQTKLAKLLIEKGANVNFRNNEGSTALISAAFFGRPEIVRLLLDAGADKTIKNKYGSTAYTSVAVPFSEVKSTYELLEKQLAPLGLELDYAYLEKVRPEIADLLK